MPKRVDHEQRRREIVAALWRVATEEGLPAATLRRVAGEAGVSMNLVQYYFTTKDQLIREGLSRLIELASGRVRRELQPWLNRNESCRLVRACLIGLLPLDDESRLSSAVHTAYLAYGIVEPGIAELLRDVPHELAKLVAPAVERGETAPGVEPLAELESLLAMASGLATGILVGTYTADEAVALVDYRLGVLFTP